MSPPFGSLVPYGEPSWYRGDHDSPYYNESHRAWRERCRRFVDAEIIPNVKDWEEAKKVPVEVYKKLYKAGLLPCVVGERGFDFVDSSVAPKPANYDVFHELILLDELSRCGSGGVVGGLIVGYSIGLTPVMNFCQPHIRDKVVPACLRGENFISLAITEPHTGSDVASIRTTAKLTADGKHYIVNGEKKWITNGVFSDYFTTAVRTGPDGMNGISVLLIPKGPGVTVRQMDCQGVWSSGTTFVEFNNVKVPVENIVGKENEGFKVIMYNFNHERWGFVVQAVRFSRLLYDVSFKYAQKRKTFGKPLIEHPVIRWKLAEMARQIEGAQGWMESLTHQLCTMPPKEAIFMLGGPLALCKVHCTKMFEYCAREASQIFGGNAYTRSGLGEVVERLYRDVRALAIPGGSEEIMLDLAVRQANGQGPGEIAPSHISGDSLDGLSAVRLCIGVFSTDLAKAEEYLLVCSIVNSAEVPVEIGLMELCKGGKLGSTLLVEMLSMKARRCSLVYEGWAGDDGLCISYGLVDRNFCEGKSLAELAAASGSFTSLVPRSTSVPIAEVLSGSTMSVDLHMQRGLEDCIIRLVLRTAVDVDDAACLAARTIPWAEAHRHFVEGDGSGSQSWTALCSALPDCPVSWDELRLLEENIEEKTEQLAAIKREIVSAEKAQQELRERLAELSRPPVCLTELDVDCIVEGVGGFDAIRLIHGKWRHAAENLSGRCFQMCHELRCMRDGIGAYKAVKGRLKDIEEAGRQLGKEIGKLERQLEPIGDMQREIRFQAKQIDRLEREILEAAEKNKEHSSKELARSLRREEEALGALMDEYSTLSVERLVDPSKEDFQKALQQRNKDILDLSLRLKTLRRRADSRCETVKAAGLERAALEDVMQSLRERVAGLELQQIQLRHRTESINATLEDRRADHAEGVSRLRGEKRGQYEHTLPEEDFPEYPDEQQFSNELPEPPKPVVEPLEYLSQDSLPKFTQEQLRENRMRRIPYAEVREAVMLERAEEAEVTKIIGAEIRAKCRPEIDEYVDCVTDRYLSLLKCKPIAWKMRRCVKKYETSDFVANRMRERIFQQNFLLAVEHFEISEKHIFVSLDDPLFPSPQELMAQREEAGTSITRRNELSKANKCFIPKDARARMLAAAFLDFAIMSSCELWSYVRPDPFTRKSMPICQRCQRTYDNMENTDTSCRYHPKQFVCRWHPNERKRDAWVWDSDDLGYYGNVDGDDYKALFWDCCGSEDPQEPGCEHCRQQQPLMFNTPSFYQGKTSRHVSYDEALDS
ncbi:hypothetical protein FOL47_000301 [Perkinsus chesapeaki]|uniref:Uncharacterized protein n=1 Tax=Perkinsus chesapeaki TaxID=330153 RepID=A0A7J6MM05_PERCH|nr:hypothetical protein FOL47_000301 [Perkinsus chesapeaki]